MIGFFYKVLYRIGFTLERYVSEKLHMEYRNMMKIVEPMLTDVISEDIEKVLVKVNDEHSSILKLRFDTNKNCIVGDSTFNGLTVWDS